MRKRRRWVSGVRVTFITKICRVDRRCEPSKTDKSRSQTCRKSDVCVHISYTQGDSQPFQQTVFISFLFGLIFPQHDLLLFSSSVTWCWDNTNNTQIYCSIHQCFGSDVGSFSRLSIVLLKTKFTSKKH